MPPLPASGITPKQELFIQEYLKDLNGTQAAIRAGYSSDNANNIASENLAKPYIRERIESAQKERLDRVKIQQDDVMEELKLLLKSSIDSYQINPDGTVDVKSDSDSRSIRAVSGLKRKVKRYTNKAGEPSSEIEEVEIKLWDKTRAVEMAMKHLGLLATDKLELTLTSDAKNIIQRLAQLAIECCAEDKRERLLSGLEEVKVQYNAK